MSNGGVVAGAIAYALGGGARASGSPGGGPDAGAWPGLRTGFFFRLFVASKPVLPAPDTGGANTTADNVLRGLGAGGGGNLSKFAGFVWVSGTGANGSSAIE